MGVKSHGFGKFYLSLFFVLLYFPVLSVILYSFNISFYSSVGGLYI